MNWGKYIPKKFRVIVSLLNCFPVHWLKPIVLLR